MTIRDCPTVAIDGTHASGKTTLIHALTAHYRRQGVNVAAMGEPARSSPFMEEIVIHGRGSFDLVAEVDVFAAHLRYQLRTARNHQLLIADKTIVNVLAYARMLLDIAPGSNDATVLDAMEHFCRAWAPTYDLVFFTHDHYDQPSDGFRAKVAGLQDTAATTLRTLYDQLGVAVIDVPLGLETDQRVEWVAGRVAESGLVSTR
ncbi:thymidylate kinase [Actinophytocola xinjiangensis]|uniref:Thymidylate kinase n=1 Tax=Actinophytocola xinjiangensis TaxID=485602 RepID=A0A7Z1AYR1_9PSEU|nr:AAA family ATPase [Actinophytocola xinjiangensis]OLF10927.1 thymidylate kinase [Actinophytocola xinjiangensis]